MKTQKMFVIALMAIVLISLVGCSSTSSGKSKPVVDGKNEYSLLRFSHSNPLTNDMDIGIVTRKLRDGYQSTTPPSDLPCLQGQTTAAADSEQADGEIVAIVSATSSGILKVGTPSALEAIGYYAGQKARRPSKINMSNSNGGDGGSAEADSQSDANANSDSDSSIKGGTPIYH